MWSLDYIVGLILLGDTLQDSIFKHEYKNRMSLSTGLKKCLDTVKSQHDFWSMALIRQQFEDDIGLEQALNIPTYSLDLSPYKPAWLSDPAKMENRILYVIYKVDPKNALSILRQTGWWNPRDKIIIFQDNLEIKHNISQIFQYFYDNTQFKALNIALVSMAEVFKIQAVYQNNPFYQQLAKKSDCSDLFPNYFNDINGYSLPVSIKPSLMFNKLGTLYVGPEAQIAGAIISAMNGTVTYSEQMDTGFGYEELPLNGILGDISTGRTTASFNGRQLTFKLHELKNKLLIELTYPNYQDNIVAVIPFDFVQSKFLKAYYPFDLLYITLGCFIAVILYFKLFIPRLSTVEICSMMISIHMNQLVLQWTTKPMKIKIVLMSLMVVCFFVNASWFSMLTKAVTVPVKPVFIRTVEQLAFEESCKLKITRRLQRTLDDVLDRTTFLALNRSRFDVVESDEALSELSQFNTCKHRGAILGKLVTNHLRISLIRRKMKCFLTLRESLVPAWATFPVTFGSPFLPQIDAISSRIVQAGLHVIFFKKFNYVVNRSKRGRWYYRSSYHNTPLSFFYTTFLILSVGYISAIIIFCLEVICFKFKGVTFLWIKQRTN